MWERKDARCAGAGGDALPPVGPCGPVPSPSAPQSLGRLSHPGLSAGAVHKGKGCQGHGLGAGIWRLCWQQWVDIT